MDNDEIISKTFESLHEFRNRTELRRMKKAWQEIAVPCSIQEALSSLTKDDLRDICRYHDFTVSSSLKKSELVAELAAKLPRRIQAAMGLMDEGRFSFMQMVSLNDGIFDVDDFDIDLAENWRKTGIIFSGVANERKVLFMPKEILNAFQAINQKALNPILERNTEWILLSQGMLYYYGVMELQQLRNKLRDLTGEKPDHIELFSVLWKAYEFYEEIKPVNREFWAYSGVFDPEKIGDEHQARSNVDFARFSKSKLLKAGQPGYIDKSPAFYRFQDFLLSEYEMPRSKAEEITTECQHVIKFDLGPTAVLEFLATRLEFPSFESVQRLAGEVMYLTNNTRQWVIKGHSPDDLFEKEREHLRPLPPKFDNAPLPFAAPLAQPMGELVKTSSRENVIDLKTRQKIGRNDPCPCGSGRKFKQCCGKGN